MILNELREKLRISPQPEQDGKGFIPSAASLKAMTSKKSDYDHTKYEHPYTGSQKILIICTENRYLKLDNGKEFSSGNHPIETLLPMLHWAEAGFDVDIATVSGKPVKLEEWAMPTEDETVMPFYEKSKSKFESPLILSEVADKITNGPSPYIGVFIPGGHAVLTDLYDNKNVGRVIRWAHDNDKFLFTICHGPAALLSTTLDGEECPYKDYEIVCFPDNMDKMIPYMGYLPGNLTMYFGEKLQKAGIKLQNKAATGKVHRDRKLITGDGPTAANKFGKITAQALLDVDEKDIARDVMFSHYEVQNESSKHLLQQT